MITQLKRALRLAHCTQCGVRLSRYPVHKWECDQWMGGFQTAIRASLRKQRNQT